MSGSAIVACPPDPRAGVLMPFSMTTLPDVLADDLERVEDGTPEASSVPSVRVKRATAIFA
jgi:hypothetical protein